MGCNRLRVTTLVRSGVLPAVGNATGAPDYQEGSRKRHYPEEYRYPPHETETTGRAGMVHPTNGLRRGVLCRVSENTLFETVWKMRMGPTPGSHESEKRGEKHPYRRFAPQKHAI